MQRYGQLIIGLLFGLFFSSCENTTVRSSVPTYPVRLSINTNMGEFVHFIPENTYDYITIDKKGYHYRNYTQALAATDMIGYAGVVVFIGGDGVYNAFDMCCPHCLKPNEPVEMDGFFGVCPICGEAYDLSYGFAVPTKGIGKEALRRYPVINNGGKLTISQ